MSQIRVSQLGEGVAPIARRSGEEALYEDLRVEQRSPCHGMVIDSSMENVAVDYGDVVLWNGTPVDERFPLLAGLARAPLHRFRFIAKQ